MYSVPLTLPLDAAEAGALAGLVFQHLDQRDLTDESRSRLAHRIDALRLKSLRALPGSLARDPTHSAAYWMCADSSRASALVPGRVLIGRMNLADGCEAVVNPIHFDCDAAGAIREAHRCTRFVMPGARPPLTTYPGVVKPTAMIISAYASKIVRCHGCRRTRSAASG